MNQEQVSSNSTLFEVNMSDDSLLSKNDKENLRTVTINELCHKKERKRFIIPSYQRGYRWEIQQVTDLLDDLWEFLELSKKNNEIPKKSEYYCLQPIIVQSTGNLNEYLVIDGQQRLTTIYILLKGIWDGAPFELVFERDEQRTGIGKKTRKEFLESLQKFTADISSSSTDNGKDGDLLDFYYFQQAHACICKWYQTKDEENTEENFEENFRPLLLNRTKFIWYELDRCDTKETVQKTFSNINSGKIPLTDSELIKAVYLSDNEFRDEDPGRFELEQGLIARLWDEIERTLQGKMFWTFLGGDYSEATATRIDYLFDLALDNWNGPPSAENKLKRRFDTRIGKDKDGKRKAELWKKDIRGFYRLFCDWYDNIDLYNYIGYVMHQLNKPREDYKGRIKELVDSSRNKSKEDFVAELKERIRRLLSGFRAERIKFTGKEDEFELEAIKRLAYDSSDESSKNAIRRVLLAHNIVTANSRRERFVFSALGKESIEHIFAQRSDRIAKEDREEWITGYRKIAQEKNISPQDLAEIDALRESCRLSDDEDSFKKIFNQLITLVEENEPANIHLLGNLALLSGDKNSALSNNAFRQKREQIITWINKAKDNENDKLPPCTVDVFMKAYNGCDASLFYWSAKDAEAYVDDIYRALQTFDK